MKLFGNIRGKKALKKTGWYEIKNSIDEIEYLDFTEAIKK
jgi:hypothetical protein